ncbi:MAG: TIGR02221 family CRISPR-associated protein [Candidatus Polarisedimenticolia bacterium]
MGRNVYISFLGTGAYQETRYVWGDREANPTPYVQSAEMQLLDGDSFDAVYIVATDAAKAAHYGALLEHLSAEVRKRTLLVSIGEEMSAEGQWGWFEALLGCVQQGDRLTIDLTHSYRTIPLVAATALNFLRKARGVTVDHVLYGAYEKNRERSPIVDIAAFLAVDDWADAVAALFREADARPLTAVAKNAPEFVAPRLRDSDLHAHLEALSVGLRVANVNGIRAAARAAEDRLAVATKSDATPVERILAEYSRGLLAPLAGEGPATGRYDLDYYAHQLDLAEKMLAHQLFMQAFTALREFVGSLGLRGEKKIGSADDRARRRAADVFYQMVNRKPDVWSFNGREELKAKCLPTYEAADACGAVDVLRRSVKILDKLRNGLDHAWTMKSIDGVDFADAGQRIVADFREALALLASARVVPAAAAEAAEE